MDGVEVVLDTATAVLDATGLIVTPGGVDPHVHWLSPQVADAALAGGITTLVIQDFGPVWNLGCNPAEGLPRPGRRSRPCPLNAGLLVRGSSARPEPVEARAARRRRRAQDPRGRRRRPAADPLRARHLPTRHDVQLAIHTDGLNEALSVEDTLAAFGGRTVHAFHIEGAAAATRPTCSRWPAASAILTLVDLPDDALRRRTPRPSTWRWWRRCTCSRPGRGAGDATALRARACGRGRWPPRACCTTSA